MGVEEKFLVPRPGLLVRDPMSKNVLPEGGAVKPWIGPQGRYWRRRVADKSVSIGTPKPIAKPEPKNVDKSNRSFVHTRNEED